METIKKSVWLMLLLSVVACGGGPRIASPRDGQAFVLNDLTSFDVTFEDNEFQDRIVEVKGNFLPNFCCMSYPGSITRCFGPRAPGGAAQNCGRAAATGGGGGSSCSAANPCVVPLVAYDSGDAEKRNAHYIFITLR